MPDRNPFEETRRAGMNVPQRAVETPTRGMRRQSPRQVEDVFDPGRLYDIFDPRRLGGGGGGGRSAYLSSRFGGGLGNQFARNAGANGMLEDMLMAEAGPGMDDDDYGPSISPYTLELDQDFLYGPGDEYDFDRKRGYPGYKWGSPPVYSARGGLI